jgi:hypothetical protein
VKIERRQLTKAELASICSSRPVVRRYPPPKDFKKFTRRLTDKTNVTATEPREGVETYNTTESEPSSSGGVGSCDRGRATKRGDR